MFLPIYIFSWYIELVYLGAPSGTEHVTFFSCPNTGSCSVLLWKDYKLGYYFCNLDSLVVYPNNYIHENIHLVSTCKYPVVSLIDIHSYPTTLHIHQYPSSPLELHPPNFRTIPPQYLIYMFQYPIIETSINICPILLFHFIMNHQQTYSQYCLSISYHSHFSNIRSRSVPSIPSWALALAEPSSDTRPSRPRRWTKFGWVNRASKVEKLGFFSWLNQNWNFICNSLKLTEFYYIYIYISI